VGATIGAAPAVLHDVLVEPEDVVRIPALLELDEPVPVRPYEAWTRPQLPASGSSAFTYVPPVANGSSARMDVALAVAETLPHRKKYLPLNHRLSIRILDALSAWVDEVETELDS
jgi:hypothetical protein